ncbi:MAG: DUF1858 domain-containing protein [Magnetococcales bacterium]|nr:DUF1858 domain-containing protein [Magnetococcales bacterium]
MNHLDKNKNMAELIREHPQLAKILRSRGIDCGSCLASQVDTLEDVLRTYNLDMQTLMAEMEKTDRKE